LIIENNPKIETGTRYRVPALVPLKKSFINSGLRKDKNGAVRSDRTIFFM
jgi:hypothetical protein